MSCWLYLQYLHPKSGYVSHPHYNNPHLIYIHLPPPPIQSQSINWLPYLHFVRFQSFSPNSSQVLLDIKLCHSSLWYHLKGSHCNQRKCNFLHCFLLLNSLTPPSITLNLSLHSNSLTLLFEHKNFNLILGTWHMFFFFFLLRMVFYHMSSFMSTFSSWVKYIKSLLNVFYRFLETVTLTKMTSTKPFFTRVWLI